MKDLAILVFAYKRPHHLASLLGSLVANLVPREVPIHVFLDGPKGLQDSDQVNLSINIAEIYSSFFPNFHIHKESKNRGIYSQVLHYGDLIFSEHQQAVFLEEDLILSSTFFSTIRNLLMIYAQDSQVGCVSGHYIPGKFRARGDSSYQSLENEPYLLSRYGHNLGWATWKNIWEDFREMPIHEYESLANEGRFSQFNRRASFPFSTKLQKELKSEGKSWAIKWYAYSYLSKKGTVFPKYNQVIHTGIGHSAENYRFLTDDPLLDHLFHVTQNFYPNNITGIKLKDAEQLFRQYLRFAAGSSRSKNVLKKGFAYVLDAFSLKG